MRRICLVSLFLTVSFAGPVWGAVDFDSGAGGGTQMGLTTRLGVGAAF
jgi:hypothetical protein